MDHQSPSLMHEQMGKKKAVGCSQAVLLSSTGRFALVWLSTKALVL